MADIRVARAEDVDAIAAIDPDRLGSRDEICALVRGQDTLVAVERGEIVGLVVVRPGHFFGRDFIDLLYVGPRWRQRGIGRALMQAALGRASTSRVFVSTNESNAPMRELLRGEGWTPSGVLAGLDEDDPEHVFFHDVGDTPLTIPSR